VGDGLVVTTANLRPLSASDLNGWHPGTHLPGPRATLRGITSGVLAPDGRHWFGDDDGTRQVTVYDSEDSAAHQPTHPGFVAVVPYEWLGDDTVAAVGFRTDDGTGLVSLLTCQIATTCQVAAADVGAPGGVIVPNGLRGGPQ
jgi:hypothetical protein